MNNISHPGSEELKKEIILEDHKTFQKKCRIRKNGVIEIYYDFGEDRCVRPRSVLLRSESIKILSTALARQS
jgi:hypothetical protein